MPTEEGKPYHQQGARCGETTAQAKRRRADPLTDSWADRMESDVEDPMDYSKEVTWDDKTPKLREVSEKTNTLLTKACTSRLNNVLRLSHRSSHPLPKVPATRTPQLDPVIKLETSAAVKAADKELARIQTFVLDALAPLTTLLEEGSEQVVEAAVQLIGNVSARLSHLWGEKVTKHINEALMPIVQQEENFKDAPPQLFGPDFAKKGKEHMDQMKA